ncbi:hypothetical protein RNJ44_00577 [Nakaseomyces bracarensis]|uniref:Uncharacterized protein n=1 Tax=Nakaseomyces bracarensis TaxID=273131 RepID=A0ABR4NRQ6_9SACH
MATGDIIKERAFKTSNLISFQSQYHRKKGSSRSKGIKIFPISIQHLYLT